VERCHHNNLELLPAAREKLRCRHCHLTVAADELSDGFCPECFDTSGARRYDFEPVAASNAAAARYRCEDCGAIVDAV
jgi:rubrerythrin